MSTIVQQLHFTLCRMNNLLADRIKIAIAESGVSVAMVAAACDVSLQAVYKWMRGESLAIDGAHLVELAALTKHNAQWIAKGTGPKISEYATSGAHARLFRATENLSEDEIDQLCKIGTAFAQSKVNRTGTD
jgi:transposase-like protein